jgi:hypothetical protein
MHSLRRQRQCHLWYIRWNTTPQQVSNVLHPVLSIANLQAQEFGRLSRGTRFKNNRLLPLLVFTFETAIQARRFYAQTNRHRLN